MVDKSLSELLQEAGTLQANFPPPNGMCHATFCLNREGKPARADEHVASIGFCMSTQFIWSEDDQCRICARCWTPEKKRDDPE